MSDALPDPYVTAEVDLRGMDYMPLKGELLFNSVTWLNSSAEGRCAALQLWWHAFAKEVPAGSLPNSDRLLAAYAGFGGGLKRWQKVKTEALRGWNLCADGLLYHKTLSQIVIEAWKRRSDYRNEKAAKAERQRRWRERIRALVNLLKNHGIKPPKNARMEQLERLCVDAGVDASQVPNVDAVDVSGDASVSLRREGKRREEKGKEDIDVEEAAADESSPKVDAPSIIFGRGLAWLIAASGTTEATCRTFLGKLIRDYGPDRTLEALRACQAAAPVDPKAWITKRLKGNGHDKEHRVNSGGQSEGQSAKSQGIAAAFHRRSLLPK
jgi:hypothetical protein